MNRRGILVVVSGFSGVGKGTLMRKLMDDYSNYALSISATTRLPRTGEIHAKDYFFVGTEEFEQMISQDQLIEHAIYVNNYYGTPKSFVEEQMESGKDVILEIEIQGAVKVKEKFPDALLMFVVPPCAAELKSRLEGRGTEAGDIIQSRLRTAVMESEGIEKYDYILVNDDLDECLKTMHSIIQNEHWKVNRNLKFIENMKKELKVFSKGE